MRGIIKAVRGQPGEALVFGLVPLETPGEVARVDASCGAALPSQPVGERGEDGPGLAAGVLDGHLPGLLDGDQLQDLQDKRSKTKLKKENKQYEEEEKNGNSTDKGE